MHSRDLSETVVAITGATSGIGRETARQLVEAGARVALGARRADRLDALIAELGPDKAVGVQMDVRFPADNAKLVGAALDRWGQLDSVVPNAGIGMYGGILDQSDEQLTTMMDTNYAGTVFTVRAALPAMLRAGAAISSFSPVSPGSAVAPTRRCTPGPSMRRWVSPGPWTVSSARRGCASP